MRGAIAKRIRITKNGKVLRRAMGLGHFRSKKRSTQLGRRSAMRTLTDAKALLKQNQ